MTKNTMKVAWLICAALALFLSGAAAVAQTITGSVRGTVTAVSYTHLGQPIMLRYGYQQSFRYIPCFANQQYLDYLKKVVRYALIEVKTDFIHFDNFGLTAEPYSCHCNHCKDGFRNHLRTKYAPQQRKERLGFDNVDYVNPPLWNSQNRPEQLDIISDPVFQEWIDYRCQTMTCLLYTSQEERKHHIHIGHAIDRGRHVESPPRQASHLRQLVDENHYQHCQPSKHVD